MSGATFKTMFHLLCMLQVCSNGQDYICDLKRWNHSITHNNEDEKRVGFFNHIANPTSVPTTELFWKSSFIGTKTFYKQQKMHQVKLCEMCRQHLGREEEGQKSGRLQGRILELEAEKRVFGTFERELNKIEGEQWEGE